MIYLKNISEAQAVFIPRNGEHVTGDMALVIRNTADLQEYSIPVMDLNTSGSYFNLAVELPDGIADGEWQYSLKNGNIVLSCGLLCLGDLDTPSQHETTITYHQYES